MKRLTDIFLLLCLVLAAVSCKDSGEERSHVLKVYNWADYIDEDVLAGRRSCPRRWKKIC